MWLWQNFIISPLATHFVLLEAAEMFNFLVILGETNNIHIHSSCRPRTHAESPLLCSHKLDMTNIKSQRNFILTEPGLTREQVVQ